MRNLGNHYLVGAPADAGGEIKPGRKRESAPPVIKRGDVPRLRTRATINGVGFLSLSVCWFAIFSLTSVARAQTGLVEAEVRTVRGEALRTSLAQPAPAQLKRGDRLSPEDSIETRRNSFLVISLTDGSQVTVFAGTRLRLKDFRRATSGRELLELSVGRVQVKIRHLFNVPNPYRVASPAASIAVRGTEFLVDVQAGGETTVRVIEGRVEVSPFAQPNEVRSLTAGQQVIVRVDGRIGLALPGPGLNDRSLPTHANNNPVTQLGAAYQRSVDAVVQNSLEIQPTVFSAFGDAHLDSLENPAYASEFKQAQGRLLLAPSAGKSDRRTAGDRNDANPGSEFPYTGTPHRYDYTVALQASFFSPLWKSRFVIGGNVSSVRTSLQSLLLYRTPEDALAAALNVQEAGVARLSAIDTAIVLSRSLGARERSSLGIQIEYLSGNGAFINVHRTLEAQLFGGTGIETETSLGRVRFTAGLAHDFGAGRKLGYFYRQGITSVDQQNGLRTPGNRGKFFDEVNVTTHSHEIGVRWRSPINGKLFYGVESSFLHEDSDSRRLTFIQSRGSDRDQAWRGVLGGGLGWMPRRNTFFSLDLSGAKFAVRKPLTSGPLPIFRFREESGLSLSAHAAVQSDLGQKSFVTGSFLVNLRSARYLFDNSAFTSIPNFLPELQSPYRRRLTNSFSTAGFGWKFKPTLIGEYLFSMDHYRRAPSHSLLFRYVFDVKVRPEN